MPNFEDSIRIENVVSSATLNQRIDLNAGYTQKAEHIRLVKGTVRVNPHLRVLCPTLARGVVCRKGKQHKKGDYLRPKLLVKNHSNPDLQLWSCEGCPEMLLRIEII